MKVLVIGSGGREHALVWKLAQSPHVTELCCAPGNAGIAQEQLLNGTRVEIIGIGAEEIGKLRDFAQQRGVNLTVVGPDNPLALGIVELVCVVGLIVPSALRRRPKLTVVAATILAIESLVFIGVHVKYGEVGSIVMSIVLGLFVAFIAYGRTVLKPLS